jgi:hypothetical protein
MNYILEGATNHNCKMEWPIYTDAPTSKFRRSGSTPAKQKVFDVVAQEFHGAARWNHVPLYRNENLQI